MDVFKFSNPTHPMQMQQGVLLNGLKSKMWVERYAEAGEFTFIADTYTGMRKILPIGSFVSHADTAELMIVENHEINEVVGQNSEIVITGRGFETFFENRIVGANKTFPTSGDTGDYVLTADYSYNQAMALIKDHILAANLIDVNDALPYVSVITDLVGALGVSVERSLKVGTLYERLLEVLAIDTLGVRIIRPGAWSPLGAGSPNVAVDIHKGQDRTASIIFSNDTGEIVSSDYLWSNKKSKNAALITGRWVRTTVVPAATEYNRRWMTVDASDIDQNFSAAPAGTDLTAVVTAMQQRGIQALSAQIDVALTKADVSKNATNSAFRKDFDVGDLITVFGSYNETSTMRISEFVEIEDETGASSYPTLTVI